jgi:ACS family pantothenate transporter-like MFS transporter
MATKRLADSSVSAASADSITPRPTVSRELTGFQGSARRSWRTIQRYIWDDPDKPKEERWFLFKLDVFMLTISCLGYFSKGLDQANISNAYVSGMKEALSLKGNELTYAGNVFTAGYVIGQLPAVMLATRVRPSLLIPTVEILWSVCTFCSATVKTAPKLYAVRFFVSLCESAYFPTVIYMLSSWYTKGERGKRLTIFVSPLVSEDIHCLH